MRWRRGIRGAGLAAVGAAGLVVSVGAGLWGGRAALGGIDPVYRGYAAGERPWRSSERRDPYSDEPPVATYASVPAFGVRDPMFGLPVSDGAAPDGWERKLEADYRRWQASIDAENRRYAVLDDAVVVRRERGALRDDDRPDVVRPEVGPERAPSAAPVSADAAQPAPAEVGATAADGPIEAEAPQSDAASSAL